MEAEQASFEGELKLEACDQWEHSFLAVLHKKQPQQQYWAWGG